MVPHHRVEQGKPLPEHPKAPEVCYFRDYDELERLMASLKEYKGVPACGSEFLLPAPGLGVHQSDHLTVVLPSGKVKVLRTMFWGDCTGETSHSSTSAYFVDCRSETIVAPTRWYSPSFRNASAQRVGEKIPGTREACIKSCEMHREG